MEVNRGRQSISTVIDLTIDATTIDATKKPEIVVKLKADDEKVLQIYSQSRKKLYSYPTDLIGDEDDVVSGRKYVVW